MELSNDLQTLSGIGNNSAKHLYDLGLYTLNDLIHYYPKKYYDLTNISSINNLQPGIVTIKVKLHSLSNVHLRRTLNMTTAIAEDSTGRVKIIWFNQPYRLKSIKSNTTYYLSGDFKLSNRQFSIINPTIEEISDQPLNSARIVPIYKDSKFVSSNMVRRFMHELFSEKPIINELLPKHIIQELGLVDLGTAYHDIHFPSTIDNLNAAKYRLQFNELFPLMLANYITKTELRKNKSYQIDFNLQLAKDFVAKLPFKLTDDQRKVIWIICKDLQKDYPMNRLVEGDVGSGKTVVVVMAAVMALSAGYQVAFMAPTELLAQQHANTIINLLKPLGMDKYFYLLTGSMTKKHKQEIIDKVNASSSAFIVGTHSLLSSGINWDKLSLLIIDEQHRFGVDQRMMIQKQSKHLPHFLSITATPIPRSLALTIFNDLKLSKISQKPANRQEIITKIIYPSDFNYFKEQLAKEINNGRQAYIVCPLIQEGITTKGKISANQIYEMYKQLFPKINISLIHGQIKPIEQDKIMTDFKENKIKILIATSIIEVGVDIPNASIMAIYGPERFGLAQLHQLRGRVGRGVYNSYCYLILSSADRLSSRMQAFVDNNDGFKLSEIDYAIRGPGLIYGKLQHGKISNSMLTLDDQMLNNDVNRAIKSFINAKDKLIKNSQLAVLVESAQQIINLN